MKYALAPALLLASLFLATLAEADDASPVAKVLQMLKGMKEESLKEKQDESVQFAAYKQWCESETSAKARELESMADDIGLLQADVATANASVTELSEKIKGLESDIADWTASKENATAVRNQEEETYRATHKDYTESIAAIMKASRVLKAKASGSTEQKEAVSLLSAMPKVSEAAAKQVTNFLEMYQSDVPDTPAYQYSTSTITDMLENLREKFADERAELEKEELNQLNAYSKQVQGIKFSIQRAEEAKSNKVEQTASEMKTASSKSTDLAKAEASQAETAKYLQEVNTTCSLKSVQYKERTKARDEELQALEKASDLLTADSVSAAEAKVSLAQAPHTALVVMRSSPARSFGEERAAAYLEGQATKYNSRILSALAVKISSSQDPLASVRERVQGLITRLQEESSQEQNHKQWCEAELATNKKSRTAKSAEVDKVTEEIEMLESDALKLGTEVSELNKSLVERSLSLVDQTKARLAEQEENNKTIVDAKQAHEAVTQAIAVLKDYYKGKAALVQVTSAHSSAPQVFEGDYAGQSGGVDGIVSILELVLQDYAQLEASTTAQESAAKDEFDKMKSELALLKVQQEKDIEYKSQQKFAKEQTAVTTKESLATAQKELDAAELYHEQLMDSCLATGSSATERNARRAEEIASLQEALRLLEATDTTAP